MVGFNEQGEDGGFSLEPTKRPVTLSTPLLDLGVPYFRLTDL